jgi:predicted nucleic acid-binding Zn ribbon protein
MAKRPRMRHPRLVGDLLHDGLKGLGIAERLREADIWRIWPEVAGPAIASRAQPLRIIGGTLTIAVSSGPWMQELSFLKEMIRQKLNAGLGEEVVREILLRSGKVAPQAVPAEEPLRPKKELTERQLAMIEEQAAAIPDAETRRAFAELMKASFELGRNGEGSGRAR